MAFVEDRHVETAGGMEALLSDQQLFDLQKKVVRTECIAPGVTKRGSTSYVEQEAWIQNLTIRDNILFDQPLDAAHYLRTILSCQLEPDFSQLQAGDLSEIGEKGINLSGGQKARVSLARAVYA
jgi:ABC-type transport system involved in cytochrome bd biosynthesis fused ATPase/permease subunit